MRAGREGSRLKAAMEREGMEVRDLAKKTGITGKTIYAYLAGSSVPNAEYAILIARALGTTVEELWG